jgi:hypothetical protein
MGLLDDLRAIIDEVRQPIDEVKQSLQDSVKEIVQTVSDDGTTDQSDQIKTDDTKNPDSIEKN